MSSRSSPVSIDAVSNSLPFGVDDYSEVNRTYLRWVETRDIADLRYVDIWTYCYVHRFFELHIARSSRSRRMHSDVDRLVDVTLQRVRAARHQIRTPSRYTSWVASTCKNIFLTYIRGCRIDGLEDPDSVVAEPASASRYDLAAMYGVLDEAISRLPEFLQDAARLRLIDAKPYREIAALTGQSIPTLRAYANRALTILRRDPRVRRVFDEIRGQ